MTSSGSIHKQGLQSIFRDHHCCIPCDSQGQTCLTRRYSCQPPAALGLECAVGTFLRRSSSELQYHGALDISCNTPLVVTLLDSRYGLGGNYKSVPDSALAAKMESSRKQMYYLNRCGKLLLVVMVVIIVSLCLMKACNTWRSPRLNQNPV